MAIPVYKPRKEIIDGYALGAPFLGKVSQISPAIVNPKTAKDCLNVLPYITGELQKRKGFNIAVNSLATRIVRIFEFERAGYATEVLIATPTALKKKNGTGTIDIKTDFTSSQEVNITNYNETAIITNGINYPQEYTGSTISNLVGSPPISYDSMVELDRLWLFRIPGDENGIHYSDAGNHHVWPIYNYEYIYTPDGDVLTGGIGFNGKPHFTKNKSLHIIHGSTPDSFIIEWRHGAKGTVAPHTLKIVQNSSGQNVMLRLADDLRIYAFDGSADVCISKGIDFCINKSAASKAQAEVDPVTGWYWLSVPIGSSTECNAQFVAVDMPNYGWQWFPITLPWQISCMGVIDGRLAVGRVDGVIDNEQDAYNDENAIIDAWWQSQDIMGKISAFYKQFTKLRYQVRKQSNSNFIISWVDEKGIENNKVINLDGQSNILSDVLYMQAFSKSISIKIRNNQLNQGLPVIMLEGEYIQKIFG